MGGREGWVLDKKRKIKKTVLLCKRRLSILALPVEVGQCRPCLCSWMFQGVPPLMVVFKSTEDLQTVWREQFRIRVPKSQVIGKLRSRSFVRNVVYSFIIVVRFLWNYSSLHKQWRKTVGTTKSNWYHNFSCLNILCSVLLFFIFQLTWRRFN